VDEGKKEFGVGDLEWGADSTPLVIGISIIKKIKKIK
jgi:hypothetical protein